MKIKCLICGREFRKPMAHVWQKHGISAIEYKKNFGLDTKRGLIPEADRDVLRDHVKENYDVVVARNLLKGGKRARFIKGDTKAGKYTRSEQTEKRLKAHWNEVAKRTGREPVIKIKIYCAECRTAKMIYPRYYKKGNNFCGVVCRNISNNKKRYI